MAKGKIYLIVICLFALPACARPGETSALPATMAFFDNRFVIVTAQADAAQERTPISTRPSEATAPLEKTPTLAPARTISQVETPAPAQSNTVVTLRPAITIGATLETPLPEIQWNLAGGYLGQTATVCGPVLAAHYAASSRGKPTFLNLGEAYPLPKRFQVLIWGDQRANFPGKPEQLYLEKDIGVTGKVEEYQGVFEMTIDQASDILVLPGGS